MTEAALPGLTGEAASLFLESCMSQGKRWTHDELMLAMNLYCKLPFGQLRHGNPLIIEVAQKLDRTPSSLSMKLCNLASLDPPVFFAGWS